MDIKLDVYSYDTENGYTAVFQTEDQALDFMNRPGHYCYSEVEDDPIPAEAETLLAVLYPLCVHGLSQSMCEDPVYHYAYDSPYTGR